MNHFIKAILTLTAVVLMVGCVENDYYASGYYSSGGEQDGYTSSAGYNRDYNHVHKRGNDRQHREHHDGYNNGGNSGYYSSQSR